MLRITQNSAPEGAKSYYSTSDYYTEEQELVGVWRGKAAERLGLSGRVDREDWDALCDNRDPSTGDVLTPRTKQDRRVGYDFNFHVPKSVSILYALTKDDRVVDAFRDSVDATMQDMEAEMQTRVRAGGKNEDRTTGNLVWGEFVHFTARPVDGVPDPHLHAHCFVFNTTWDADESRWKAGQFAGIKRDGEYFEAMFHARLARRLEELGLPVERTKRGWELQGVPQSAVRKFSRRTALIEDKARARGITDPEVKGALGARTREKKLNDLTMDELRHEWASRLSQDEKAALSGVRAKLGTGSIPEDAGLVAEGVKHAVGHCFERASVVPERKVFAEALKRSLGAAAPDKVLRAVERHGLLRGDRDGRRMATTRDVLAEEKRMLTFAREGRGTCRKLGPSGYELKRDWLNAGQKAAVRHVLESRDRVMLVRGGAGTGKTTMMKEAVEGIQAGGSRVFTFAPSAGASRGVLREEGFADADTVARLLADPKLQAQVAGSVLWIDEAGLLGTRTMGQVFDLAERLDCRVVLSGDRRQHGSVERGSALRLLEEEAGLKPADVREIQRQQGDYKAAVKSLAEGRVVDAVHQLDRLGWIREVGATDRYKALATDYLGTIEAGKSALVVSPTHLEGEWITDEIRARLKQAGRLTGAEHRISVLRNTSMTEADRAEATSYEPGDVLEFHQNAKGYGKGERMVADGTPLPLDQADKFQVFRQDVLPIAKGDLVRITRNGKTADGAHRLNNGAIYEVAGFTPAGDIRLGNGWTVAKDYGHLVYGYVVTSHASQGKTVDRVLIGQSSDSLPASSREQFYVSVSRGRERATIYTDDKAALLEAVNRSEDRVSATELAQAGRLRERAEQLYRLMDLAPTERLLVEHRQREGLHHE